MADFCKQCCDTKLGVSNELYARNGDLIDLVPDGSTTVTVICEGCGLTEVDNTGTCQGGCQDTSHTRVMNSPIQAASAAMQDAAFVSIANKTYATSKNGVCSCGQLRPCGCGEFCPVCKSDVVATATGVRCTNQQDSGCEWSADLVQD